MVIHRSIHQLQESDLSPGIADVLTDLLAFEFLAPLSTSYLPWSAFSIRPSALVNILNDLFLNNRSTIVECGSGISTFYIARLLKQNGGHLYTIEHERQWCDMMSHRLQKEGLDRLVTLIYAPLQATDLAIDNIPWYDTNAIEKQLSKETKIDLLLVDGPPAYEEHLKYSRYPAVPYFLPQLSEEYAIVLDDVNRGGEREVLSQWEALLNLKFEDREGDIAIGLSKPIALLGKT